jgi:hypothetical protein
LPSLYYYLIYVQDAWIRAEGGGGITRVLDRGNVWEKAGVNVSVVYGTRCAGLRGTYFFHSSYLPCLLLSSSTDRSTV